MPALRIKDILDSIRQVHEKIAARYRELEGSSEDEQIHLLLKDMERREESFEKSLQAFEADRNNRILNAWIPFVPEDVLRVEDLRTRLAVPHSLSELAEASILLNGTLVNAYLALAKSADLPEVRDLFRNLAELEESNDMHYAKVLLED